jgi:serine/threonine protein kinase/Tfp pilus assembly protein PilF
LFRGDFQTDDKVGPYTLLWKLGEGQFGVVWLAEKRTSITATRFALKLPIPSRVNVGAIEAEAKLWEKASGHRNVVNIIEADEYDVERNGQIIARRQIVIVSEYVPDGSLEKWLRDQGGRASVEDATAMISEILEGLIYLHAQKIIHRDLKPANILLQGQTPRIADFGISRALTTGSYRFTGPFGSLAYMAPETITTKPSKRRISKRTDLWSVGVIFYELLTGNLPFPQRDISACMDAIRRAAPAPLPSSVPSPIQDVINRTLRKNPDKRYQNATEMLSALRAASNVPPPPPPPVVRGPSAFEKLLASIKVSVVQFRRRVAAYKLPRNLVRNSILSLIAIALISVGWNEYRNWPKSYMESGKRKLAAGDEDGAIEDLSYVVSREKENAEAYLLLGNAFYNKGTGEDYQSAISNYNLFINLRKDDPRGYIGRGLAHKMICECDKAIEDFGMAINLKNDDPSYYLNRSEVFEDKGDLTNAIKDYDHAIELNKNNPELYIGRAGLFRQRGNKGDTENAIKDLTRAIEVSNNDPKYYVARALLFSNEGDIDKAIKDYDVIVSQHKDSPDYYVARAKLFFAKNDIPSGIKDYDQAIKLKNGDPDLYFERAGILFDNEKYDLAIEDYNRYSNAGRVDAAAFYNRGLCYINKNDYKKAIEQFSKALELYKGTSDENKHLGDTSFQLGLAFYDDQNYDQAIEQLGQAVKGWTEYDTAKNKAVSSSDEPAEETCTCNPSAKNKNTPAQKPKPPSSVDTDAYYYRGLALLKKGRKDEAIVDLKKTVELTTDDETRNDAKAELRKLGVK